MGSRSVVLEEGRVTIGQHSKGCRAPYRAEVGHQQRLGRGEGVWGDGVWGIKKCGCGFVNY